MAYMHAACPYRLIVFDMIILKNTFWSLRIMKFCPMKLSPASFTSFCSSPLTSQMS